MKNSDTARTVAKKTITVIVVAGLVVYSMIQATHGEQAGNNLNNTYNRAFFDMTSYVDNLESLLAKTLITNRPASTSVTLKEIWRQANLAQTGLGQLPVGQEVLANTSKFLTQVGDLAYSYNTQSDANAALSEDEYGTVQKLYGYAVTLSNDLAEIQNSLISGDLNWERLGGNSAEHFQTASGDASMQIFESVEKNFQEMPTLIYDGPFSDHMLSAEPKMNTGDAIDKESAAALLIDMLGSDTIASIRNSGEYDGVLPVYSFEADTAEGSKLYASVTKNGGRLLWMMESAANSGERNIDIDRAESIGAEFLDSLGYRDMKTTYSMTNDNVALVNYAYESNGIIYYPDMIKVQVALDTGKIVGLEAKGYLYCHNERNVATPAITQEQARASVSGNVEVKAVRRAVIPTEFNTELDVYEVAAELGGQTFLVYVNTQTGAEEKILMLIDGPEGTLAI